MSHLWKYIQSLFRNSAERERPRHEAPSSQPLHELIVRSPEELAAMEQWKQTLVCRKLCEWIGHQFALYGSLPNEIDETLDFLDTLSSKGFVVHLYKTNYTRQEAVAFFDMLKERVLAQGYRMQISDRRIYRGHSWLETTERHYLKPRPEFGAPGKIRQRFGNITILLILRNDKPWQLKFQATTYRDHLFLEADNFADLMEELV